jgi:pyrroloquinoline quinone (PQQ) biosynthesis protein C
MNTSISSEITHRTGPHQSETIDAVLALRSNTDLADVEPAEDDTETFLRELTAETLAHRALHHPYLKALAEGSVPDLEWALRDFSKLYYGYSGQFIRYLTLAISRLDSGAHRRALIENLMEESGQLDDGELNLLASIGISADWVKGIPHPELFRRFQTSIGSVAFADTDPDGIDAICWRESFLSLLAGGSPVEAIGAIGLGTEGVVRYIYEYFVRSIERYGKLHPSEYVFFTMHALIDDRHGETLLQIARDLCVDTRARYDLRKGMRKALNMRVLFWDAMYERAMARPRISA